MHETLKAGALGQPWGVRWGGRWKGGSGWGTHVHPWLIHVNVWQKSLQYSKAISLQLNKLIKKATTTTKGQAILALWEWSIIYYLLIIKLAKVENWKPDLKDYQLQLFQIEITKHISLISWFPRVNNFKTITTTQCHPCQKEPLTWSLMPEIYN